MKAFISAAVLFLATSTAWSQNALVLQSDFGVKDAAVASMKGVAFGISPSLAIHDLTHEIPVFNIWEASLRLVQTAEYWPAGTVFVSVVDPGVGTSRKSVVLKTSSGHYFVTPDNGTLTSVATDLGIEAVREIDEAVNRRQDSEKSYTFHGRDVYAFTGARLAAGVISFEEVGGLLPPEVVTIAYQQARFDNGTVYGNIPILDPQFGNIWTNINRSIFQQLNLEPGDTVEVKITDGDDVVLVTTIPYFRMFGSVDNGEPLLYLNSVNNVALAINQGSFAEKFEVQSGPVWSISLTRK